MNSDPTTNYASTNYASTNYASIDYSILRTLEDDVADNDPDVMLEFIDIFLRDSTNHMEEIGRAIEQADYRKIEISAHSLKSSAATFGARILSDIYFRMEQYARARQRESIVQTLAVARTEFARVIHLLNAERAKWVEIQEG